MLSIQLFGSPQLILDQRPITVRRRKSRALVYYLATQTTPITRDHLLAFFWPDHERPAAQQILRTTLHGLRQDLGQAVVSGDGTLALAPETEVDSRIFEAHLTTPVTDIQQLTTTLSLYQGDFLADFSLPDTSAFDDWAAVERERYRRLAIRGLTILSQHYEARGDYPAALDTLDRALIFDPLQEDLQRTCLHLHYLAGDRAGAIRRYENFRRLLDEEMGVPPMAETRAMYDAIITDKLPTPPSMASTTKVNRPGEPISPSLSAANRNDEHNKRAKPGIPMGQTRSKTPVISSSPWPNLSWPGAGELPFVGRDIELQTLHTLSASARLVLIEGEPGIGKSRLMEEFIQAWQNPASGTEPRLPANTLHALTQQPLSLIGQAHELEEALPYQPIIEALRHLLASPEWPALRPRFDLAPVWLAEIARLLPELADATFTSEAISSRADESRLWEGLFQFFLALARLRRVILVLDDLHWADASTLGLLGYLVRQSGSVMAPISFIAATRPLTPRSPLAVLVSTLTREGRLERVSLTRLTTEDISVLAQQLSPNYAHPLTAWLNQSAEGHPYILAELIREAREESILLPDGTVNLNTLSAMPPVPQTVYTLIQARLARLSEAARRVLDAAVAAGREFEFEIVARAAALSEHAALDALDELRAAGLIFSTEPGSLRYTFDHTLTMEVAYQEVGEPRHRLLHRRVAEAIESIHRDRLDSVAGLLAWHFAEGNAPRRAAPYAFRAGELAAKVAAWQVAIAFYDQALSVESDDERRLAILMALGEVRFQAGEMALASETFRAALNLAQLSQDEASQDEAQLALGRSFLPQARYAEAIALAQQLRTNNRPEIALQGEFLWGTALSLEGSDLAGAMEHLQKAATFCLIQADPATLAQIKFELGSVAAQQGDLAQAIAHYREALTAAETVPDAATTQLILIHNNLGYHLHLLNDPAAFEHARTGLKLAREKGMLGLQPYLLSTLGEIALAQDDLETAERYFQEGLTLATRLLMPERVAGLTANLGLLAQQRGQTTLALHRLSTALAQAEALGTHHLATQIRLWLVPLLPHAEAQTYLAEAHAVAESRGYHRLLDEAIKLDKDN